MPLRPYQTKLFQEVREAFRNFRAVCATAPTGSGKTRLFTEMTKAAVLRGNSVWIIVSRNELLKQTSNQLKELGIPHGRIAPGSSESKLYKVHVVSKDTLVRRYDKIKSPPNFIIFDEVHLYLERQKEIAARYPNAKILGVTATPERLDGRGLSEVYEILVKGPTIAELISQDFLTGVKYFCPPIEGIESLARRGTEYKADELQALLEERQIFGKTIEHYREHAHEKPCLVYCSSVKMATLTAQKYNDAGYLFENIDGKMSYKKRTILIDALRDGKIHGLTSCDLITYGLDVPRVSCIVMLRPTLSRALFSQMVGRGLRPWPGKQDCVILDHVNNLRQHGHPLADYEWKFHGTLKTKKPKGVAPAALHLCPACFMYFEGTKCPNCQEEKPAKPRAGLKEVDGRLIEVTGPVKMAERPIEERREMIDRINRAIDDSAIEEMAAIALELGRKPVWIYHQLNKNQSMVNVPLLYEIARVKKYKPGWAHFQAEKLKGRV